MIVSLQPLTVRDGITSVHVHLLYFKPASDRASAPHTSRPEPRPCPFRRVELPLPGSLASEYSSRPRGCTVSS
jgi:hypothetical protein